jgi:hypothetical protein
MSETLGISVRTTDYALEGTSRFPSREELSLDEHIRNGSRPHTISYHVDSNGHIPTDKVAGTRSCSTPSFNILNDG